ncbi:hypothetical protein ACE7GA_03870 [Roseomonas sp. CCTCC AB2023176]|uniref:hypothetical protein n=1 Tax=Roseomonas sp. CCTCC AB2023176 TaxID=3342640 RepID=UPI0035E1E9D7
MARAPRPPSPEKAAIKRLGETLQRGATADRMTREVQGVVDGLREAGDEETVKEWLEAMRETFAEGAEAAAEAVSDVDTSDAAGAKRARQSLAAFEATRDALDAALRGR